MESSLSSAKIAEILIIFPELSPDWLLLEKGEMLRKNNGKKVNVISSPQSNVANGDMKIEAPAELVAIIQAQAESLRAKDEQISRLITLIEKNSPTSSPSPSAPMASSPSESASSPDPVGQTK